MGLTPEPYGLDPEFEKVILWYCSCHPRFWGLVGHAIDPGSVEHPLGKLILESVRQIATELGHGPDSCLVVIQRLRRRVHEGKVTVAQVQAVDALYDEVEDGSPPEVDAVANELLPVLKRRMQSQAILLAHNEFAKRGDFTSVMSLLDSADRLGTVEQITGTQLGPGGFDQIEKSKTMDRLPTGILELDLKINGGMPRKCLGLWIGDSGAGKSIALISQAGECVRRQLFCGFVTLELPEHIQLARLYANLTGIPTNDILDLPDWRKEAKRRIITLEDQLGLCEVAEFAPYATSVQDLDEWVDQMEQKHGAKMQALIVDYADKMWVPKMRTENEYLAMRYVYEGLRRDVAVEREMWVWTGSQAGRPSKESAKKVDLHHVADSMHKIRAGDFIPTLNPREEDMLDIWVGKNRLGTARFMVGPLMTDFARARLVPVTRELGDW